MVGGFQDQGQLVFPKVDIVCIELPKAARVHATSNSASIDGIVLNVAKNRDSCAHFSLRVPYRRNACLLHT